jgi:GDP-L-fucose synthase
VVRILRANDFCNVITRSRADLDLCDQRATEEFFSFERPNVVVLAAAKVGGILANRESPVDFLFENLKIQNNVISAAYQNNVSVLLFLGSSCIYPRDCPQPISEDYLLSGPLESTNRPYAIAKIAGIELCWAYNKQYGTRYLSLMPTNLYGPGDNYSLNTSHVLPALIRKVHDAKERGNSIIKVWGTGSACREFLYSEDLARACLFLLDLNAGAAGTMFTQNAPPIINVGSGEELRIVDLVEEIKKVIGFNGSVEWDSSKPDGTPRKRLDTSVMDKLGWGAQISLRDGIKMAYMDFLKRHEV